MINDENSDDGTNRSVDRSRFTLSHVSLDISVCQDTAVNRRDGKGNEDDEDTQSQHSSQPSPSNNRSHELTPSMRAPSLTIAAPTPAHTTVVTKATADEDKQHIFPMPSYEHSMSDAMKRALASVYSEASKSVFNPLMATTYMNHLHHQHSRLMSPSHPLDFHHPASASSSTMPMNFLSRTAASLGSLPRHHPHQRCTLPLCPCRLLASPSSSNNQ